MAKAEISEFDDKVAFFTTGKSLTGKVYMRHLNDGLQEIISHASGLHCADESLTQQQFKDDCDPNKIMETFARTRDDSILRVRDADYGDFTGVSDFHSALTFIRDTEAGFMELDARVRSRFHNDPGELLAFLSDGNNREEAVKLGLIEEKPGDLSPPPAARASDSAGAGGGVEKSTPPSNTSVRVKKPRSRASEEGDDGEA